jgi:hypothetical protein
VSHRYPGLEGVHETHPTRLQEWMDRHPEVDCAGQPWDPSDMPVPNPDVVAYDDSLPLSWRLAWLSAAALTPQSSSVGPRGLGPEARSTPSAPAASNPPPLGGAVGADPSSDVDGPGDESARAA